MKESFEGFRHQCSESNKLMTERRTCYGKNALRYGWVTVYMIATIVGGLLGGIYHVFFRTAYRS